MSPEEPVVLAGESRKFDVFDIISVLGQTLLLPLLSVLGLQPDDLTLVGEQSGHSDQVSGDAEIEIVEQDGGEGDAAARHVFEVGGAGLEQFPCCVQ